MCKCRGTVAAGLVIGALSATALAAERTVLLEEFTATWCGPCVPMGTALGNMLNNMGDDDLGLVQVHISDNVTIQWGTNRANMYGVTAIPTVVLEGQQKWVGYSTQNVAAIQNAINARLAVATDVVIQMGATQIDADSWEVNGTVSLEPTGTAKTVRLWTLQLLNHYPAGTHHHNCLRQAFGGVDIALTPGSSEPFSYTINLAAYDVQHMEDVKITVFAQKPGGYPAEVYNTYVMTYPFGDPPLQGDLTNDGCIGQEDLGIVLSDYGCVPLGPPCEGDVDGDNDCDQSDLGIILANYGQGCP